MLCLFLLPLSLLAADYKSQYRDENTDYRVYMELAKEQITPEDLDKSALNAARYYTSDNALPQATVWFEEDIVPRFEKFRDIRFLKWRRNLDFPRRSSWLYPDDGCYARAALAIRNLFKWNYEVPKKVFAFGNLKVYTKNSRSGYVTWWYHVAPIIENDGVKYVLDPALSPKSPLTLKTWLSKMGKPSSMQVAICASGSYVPGSSCTRVTDGQEERAMSDQQNFLNYEWDRLKALGRDPKKELGDKPPWSVH